MSWHKKRQEEENAGSHHDSGIFLIAARQETPGYAAGIKERDIILPIKIIQRLEASLGRKFDSDDMRSALSQPSVVKALEDMFNEGTPIANDEDRKRFTLDEIRDIFLSNGVRERNVKVGNVDAFYLEAGDPSKSTVMLVHGMSNDASYGAWRYVMLELATRYYVIAPDLPGYGHTKKDGGKKGTLAYNINFIEGFVNAIGLDSVSIISSSMGGWTSLGYTLKNPERVSRLVGLGSGGLSDMKIPFVVRMLTTSPRLTEFMIDRIRENDKIGGKVIGFVGKSVRRNTDGEDPEARSVTSDKIMKMANDFLHSHSDLNAASLEFLHDQLRSSLLEIGPDYIKYKIKHQKMINGFKTLYIDSIGALNDTDIPYLLIHGKKDPLFALPKIKVAVERLAHHTMIELDDCTHRPHIEIPEKVIGPLLDFLGGEEKVEESRDGRSVIRSITNALRRAA